MFRYIKINFPTYAVIQGVEVRGERGNYRTQRVKFNSNTGT